MVGTVCIFIRYILRQSNHPFPIIPHLHSTVFLTHNSQPTRFVRFPGYNSYVYELVGRLESASLAPNPDTYRALLRLCAQAGNPLLAERYLEQMQLDQGLEPGREHYHALLHAYAMYVCVCVDVWGLCMCVFVCRHPTTGGSSIDPHVYTHT